MTVFPALAVPVIAVLGIQRPAVKEQWTQIVLSRVLAVEPG